MMIPEVCNGQKVRIHALDDDGRPRTYVAQVVDAGSQAWMLDKGTLHVHYSDHLGIDRNRLVVFATSKSPNTWSEVVQQPLPKIAEIPIFTPVHIPSVTTGTLTATRVVIHAENLATALMPEAEKRNGILDTLASTRANLVKLATEVAKKLACANGTVTSVQVFAKLEEMNVDIRSMDKRWMGAVFRADRGWKRVGWDPSGSHSRPVAVWEIA